MSVTRGSVRQRSNNRRFAAFVVFLGITSIVVVVGFWFMFLRFPPDGSYYDTGFRYIGFPLGAVVGPPAAGLSFSQYARFRWWGTLFYRITPSGVSVRVWKWWLPYPRLVALPGSHVTLVVDQYPLVPSWRRWTCEVDGKAVSIRAIDRADPESLREFKQKCASVGVSVSWTQG